MSSIPSVYTQNASASRTLRVEIAINQSRSQRSAVIADRQLSTEEPLSAGKSQTEAGYKTERQQPGIHVSISSQRIEPEVRTYEYLRTDGRRKPHVSLQKSIVQSELNTGHSFEDEQVTGSSSRKPGPKSSVVLNNFMQKMIGIDTPPVPGTHINITI